MITSLKLYRRRYIPDEKVWLKDDEIVSFENGVLITKWRTLKPRKDINRGISAYFLNDGVKVSRVLKEAGKLVYYYCDIIEAEEDADGGIIFHDLLLDIVVYPDGSARLLDLGEVSEALKRKLLPEGYINKALERADLLLEKIYEGKFGEFTRYVDVISP